MYLHNTRSVHIDQSTAAISVCAMDDGRVAITAFGVFRSFSRSNLRMYTFSIEDAEKLHVAFTTGGTVTDQSGGCIGVFVARTISQCVVTAYHDRSATFRAYRYVFDKQVADQLNNALVAAIKAANDVPLDKRYVFNAPTEQPVVSHHECIGQGI